MITKSPFLPHEATSVVWMYGYLAPVSKTCPTDTFVGDFYYNSGTEENPYWHIVPEGGIFCGNSVNLKPDLIPLGIQCPSNHFTGSDKIRGMIICRKSLVRKKCSIFVWVNHS